MARIEHIAIMARDNAALAEFYKTTFGMHEVFVQPAGRSGRQAYYLSDGHINLAILPAGPDTPEGINHLGFKIEDMDETAKTAREAGASQEASSVPRDGRFAETFVRDPVGTRIDLSVAGWATQPLTAEESAARLEGIAPMAST